jgi:cytochrome c oxidase assembly protein subunit 15
MENYNKQISRWLFLCCVMVAVMVMVGGLTRLTGSGLSMTGWEPITGWFPPMNDAAWQAEFARYQQSPQYLKVNGWMGVEEFKGIFWLEFVHRLIGRIAGVVFLLPLLYFVYKRAISKDLALRFSSIFALGAVQGVIGWLMVSSGLKDDPRVSQYWLAFHLAMAFVLFAILFWLALWSTKLHSLNESVVRRSRWYARSKSTFASASPRTATHSVKATWYKNKSKSGNLFPFSVTLTVLIFLQVIMGAFVAGSHAGFIYNTFPLMEGKVIPDGLFPLVPWYKGVFEDVKTVQFIHRCMAYVVVVAIIAFWFIKRKSALKPSIKHAIDALLIMVLVQFALGVATLLMVVPVALASAHQVGALVLFAISLYVNYTMSQK